MALLVDTEYLLRISFQLPLFKQMSTNLYNFRCPLCGDSKKDERLKRGYCFKDKKRDRLYFKCHNCNLAMPFSYFLDRVNKEVFKEYKLAQINFHRGVPGSRQPPKKKKVENIKYEKPSKLKLLEKKSDKYYNGLTPLSNLSKDHTARAYIESRQIPNKWLDEIFYCDDFVNYVNSIIPGKLKNYFKEDRIVIPLISADGEMFGFQGRSLREDCEKKYRYMTIVFNKDYPKVFGAQFIDPKKPVMIVEGPFDAMFMDNCIAACGAAIHTVEADVYMLDNEPRNEHVVKTMKKLLKRNKELVILDPIKYYGKDINDMILDGKSINNVKHLIKTNCYKGIKGLVKLKNWSKV